MDARIKSGHDDKGEGAGFRQAARGFRDNVGDMEILI
jgi:hypothetical protein